MSNTKRNTPTDDKPTNTDVLLEQLAGEIDDLERDLDRTETTTIFEIGARLNKAKDAAQPKQWLDWLRLRLERYSERTAQNYMAAARLRDKNARLADLTIARLITRDTLYSLVQYENDPAFKAIVKALDKATADGTRLTAPKALEIAATAHHFFHWQRVSAKYGDLLPRAMTIEQLLDLDDEARKDVQEAITAKLRVIQKEGRAPMIDDVTAAYSEVTGTKARVTIDESESEPKSPAMPERPAVLHVAQRVKARQKKQRELSADVKELNICRALLSEIDSQIWNLPSDQLAKVLQFVADLKGLTRADLLDATMGDIEQFNTLASLYGWELEPESEPEESKASA